ncbi:MAG: LptF/LptG family permease [Bryobacteraceae bacterium]
MRILGRYIFREILTSSLLGMALATAIIFLQGVGRLFEVLVRSSPRLDTILYLFALSLPPLLPLTIPFGTLVGILVGLGRLATDGEITAMRAAGSSSRKVLLPVMLFATIAMAVSGAMTLRLTPLSIRVSKCTLATSGPARWWCGAMFSWPTSRLPSSVPAGCATRPKAP